MDEDLRNRISAAVDSVAGDREVPAGSLAWEAFAAELGGRHGLLGAEHVVLTPDVLRHLQRAVDAVWEKSAASLPVPEPAHAHRWHYRAHQVEETATGGGLASLMQAAQGRHRTLVLQRCDGCGDLRVLPLPGKWDIAQLNEIGAGPGADGGGAGSPA